MNKMTVRKPRKRTASTATGTKATATARTRKTTKTAAKTKGADSGSGFAGFSKGSVSEVAAIAMARGGQSRTDIMRVLRAADKKINGDNTLSQSWSVSLSSVLRTLLQKGWTETGFYKLVPPAGSGIEVPDEDAPLYMPEFSENTPRRGRNRGVPRPGKEAVPAVIAEEAEPVKTKTRRTKTATKPADASAAKPTPARPRARRARKAA